MAEVVEGGSGLPEIEEFVPDPSWPKPGLYEHYRGGKYTLIEVGYRKSDDEEPWVFYKCEQPVRGKPAGTPWFCPLSEWIEEVPWPNWPLPRARYFRLGNI